MAEAASLAIAALALAGAYGLIALGFVVVMNATGRVNFAHGDLVALAALLASLLAARLDVPAPVTLVAVVAVMAAAGVALNAVAFVPLRGKAAERALLAGIAAAILIQNTANGLTFGQPFLTPPVWPGPQIALGALNVPRHAIATVAIAGALIAAVLVLFRVTRLGRMLRAVADDRELAEATGLRAGALVAFGFALAAGLAGVAGLLIGYSRFLTPSDGTDLMIKAYMACVIAGWGRLSGAAAGTLAIAFFEVIVARYAGFVAGELALYGAFLVLLAVRPRGLFGPAVGIRVS